MEARHTLHLLPTREAPSLARGFIRENCQEFPSPVLEDACLLTSEVVTNAVVHAQTMITVALDCADGQIEVAVEDDVSMTELPRPAAVPFPLMWEGGRGLTIVDNVARDWGVLPSASGKRVWFRLP